MGKLDELAKRVGDRRIAAPPDQELEKLAPFLWEMLTQDRWGDGTERVLPTITISRVPGAFRVTLTDDALWIKKSVVVAVLSDLAGALEVVLCDESPWEKMERSYRNKKGPPIPEEKGTRRKKG